MRIALTIVLGMLALTPRSLDIRSRNETRMKELSVESRPNPIQAALITLMTIDRTDFSLDIGIGAEQRLRLSQKFASPNRSLLSISLLGAR